MSFLYAKMRRSEAFYKMGNYEDKIYSLDETVLGQTQAMSQVVQKTLENNGGVGIITDIMTKTCLFCL